jgi:pimeloyl-ACP methyl ester carboxylesterase
VYIEADVIPGDASERVLVLHSFGESFAHSRLRTILSGKPRRATLVFLHAVHKFGHHAFADSDVNGSWSRALIEELLPALPPASKTHLLGDGLGGWGALYLKGRFPERFADAWALDPDPIDFRNFFGLDLTKIPQQIYRDEAGKRRPFTKMLSIEESAIRESVLSANGGRWGSWEAIFGPRTSEGIQRQMFGRLDGSVDPVVCNAWLRYNLSARPWAKGMRVITEPEIEDILQSK